MGSSGQAAAGSDRGPCPARACGPPPPSHAMNRLLRTNAHDGWRRPWGAMRGSRDSSSSSLEAACPPLLLQLTQSTLPLAPCECAGLSDGAVSRADRPQLTAATHRCPAGLS